MNKVNYVLAENSHTNEGFSMLIKEENITQVIEFEQRVFKISGHVEKLLADFTFTDEEYNCMEEISDVENILNQYFPQDNFEVSCIKEWDYSSDNVVYIAPIDKEIYSPTNCYLSYVYEWHDGHNWKTEFVGDYYDKITVDEDSTVRLDNWVEGEWYTGRKFEHEWIVPIIENNTFAGQWLLGHWSQWGGTHNVGKIMSEREIREYLNDLPNSEQLLIQLHKMDV